MSDDKKLHFVDTNIFIYAYGAGDPHKKKAAQALLLELWENKNGCISIQVLQELYVNLTQKTVPPVEVEKVGTLIQDLSVWQVHRPDTADILSAIYIQQKYKLSFWDSMILQSALSKGCDTLWSEDLTHGQNIEGLVIKNPFAG